MFNLPKQLVKQNQKSPHQSHILNQTKFRKRTNINQIKEEIEFILKRKNSPLSFNVEKEIDKSQSHIHHHLLQRKRSKILQRASQENVEKAKNNRKIYEEYLMGDLAAKSYNKTLQLPRQTLQTFALKQKLFSKQIPKDFSTSKSNFKSSQTLEPTRKQKNSQSMFTEKEIQHLGLGKLLFYKDSNVKLKRSNLLNGQTSTEKRNFFKNTARESFTHELSLDINRYLKHFERSAQQEEQKKTKKPLIRDTSLEIIRKDIIPKQSVTPQLISQKNNEEIGYLNSHKDIEQNPQKQVKISVKHELSPHLNQTNQTLNVMDQELLVYYGKMKNRKPNNHYLPSATHRTTILNRSNSKSNESSSLTKYFDIGTTTSFQIKKPLAKEQSWKFHNFDPWEKHQPEDEFNHENVFGALDEGMNSTQFQKVPSIFQS